MKSMINIGGWDWHTLDSVGAGVPPALSPGVTAVVQRLPPFTGARVRVKSVPGPASRFYKVELVSDLGLVAAGTVLECKADELSAERAT